LHYLFILQVLLRSSLAESSHGPEPLEEGIHAPMDIDEPVPMEIDNLPDLPVF
jgi:hypothetical protein